jgi:carboxypeptidase Q
VVGSFSDLAAKAAQARGKIVLFDVPFTSYGETVQYRGRGAIEAAKGRRRRSARSIGDAVLAAHAAHRGHVLRFHRSAHPLLPPSPSRMRR